jgi:hypothetical protein
VPVSASNSSAENYRALQDKADELRRDCAFSYNGPKGAWPRRVLSGWRLEFLPDASPLGRRYK